MIKDMSKYDRALVLSSDGDFISVIKHIKHNRKDVLVLARGPRTAKEIKHFAGSNFRDFEYLKYQIGQGVKKPKKSKWADTFSIRSTFGALIVHYY